MGSIRKSGINVARSFDVEFSALRAGQEACERRHISPRIRFPAMFSGSHLGLTLFRGWNPILSAACSSVQRLLIRRPLAFHWVQLQEEQGAGHFLYSLGEHCRYAGVAAGHSRRVMILVTQEEARDLVGQIDGIVNEAERLSSEACLVCGAHTFRRKYFGRELPLCLHHQPELLDRCGEEGLESVWRHSIEWEASGDWKG